MSAHAVRVICTVSRVGNLPRNKTFIAFWSQECTLRKHFRLCKSKHN